VAVPGLVSLDVEQEVFDRGIVTSRCECDAKIINGLESLVSRRAVGIVTLDGRCPGFEDRPNGLPSGSGSKVAEEPWLIYPSGSEHS
jgi:hypothetical protein